MNHKSKLRIIYGIFVYGGGKKIKTRHITKLETCIEKIRLQNKDILSEI